MIRTKQAIVSAHTHTVRMYVCMYGAMLIRLFAYLKAHTYA